MQVLIKAGDKFRIGNDVTLEILTVGETTAEVEVTTHEGSYVEIIEPPTCNVPWERRQLLWD